MSDKIECDGCGKTGARKLGAIAPKGWMYAEIHDNAETFYVYACSAECTRLEWKSGPGSLGLAETSASEAVILFGNKNAEHITVRQVFHYLPGEFFAFIKLGPYREHSLFSNLPGQAFDFLLFIG